MIEALLFAYFGTVLLIAIVCAYFAFREYGRIAKELHEYDAKQERIHTDNDMPKPVYDFEGNRVS